MRGGDAVAWPYLCWGFREEARSHHEEELSSPPGNPAYVKGGKENKQTSEATSCLPPRAVVPACRLPRHLQEAWGRAV